MKTPTFRMPETGPWHYALVAGRWNGSTEWGAIPWTIKAYAALHIASYVFGLARMIESGAGFERLTPAFWLYLIVSVVLIVGVIRRSRAAWIAALLWELWSLVPSLLFLGMEPKDDVPVSTIFVAVGLVLLVLLLHPLTRAWSKSFVPVD